MEKKVIIELVMDEIRDELVAGKDEEYYRLKNYTQEELNNPENNYVTMRTEELLMTKGKPWTGYVQINFTKEELREEFNDWFKRTRDVNDPIIMSYEINKWIKVVCKTHVVIHGLRHSFRDRLRAVQAPVDVIDQLGGWSYKSIGETYGDGYQLDVLNDWMQRIEG